MEALRDSDYTKFQDVAAGAGYSLFNPIAGSSVDLPNDSSWYILVDEEV